MATRGAKKTAGPTPVEAIRHDDKRMNIPTDELRSFVADHEKQPKALLYPRDPSLDPQLVWKGKDEQDRADLAVPVVPVYIQESIEPRAIVENVRGGAAGSPGAAFAVRDVRRAAVRAEDRVLRARAAVVEPDDPGGLAAGDDEPAEKEELKGRAAIGPRW